MSKKQKIDALVAHIGTKHFTGDPLDLMNWAMTGINISPNDMKSLKRIAVLCELCSALVGKKK